MARALGGGEPEAETSLSNDGRRVDYTDQNLLMDASLLFEPRVRAVWRTRSPLCATQPGPSGSGGRQCLKYVTGADPMPRDRKALLLSRGIGPSHSATETLGHLVVPPRAFISNVGLRAPTLKFEILLVDASVLPSQLVGGRGRRFAQPDPEPAACLPEFGHSLKRVVVQSVIFYVRLSVSIDFL